MTLAANAVKAVKAEDDLLSPLSRLNQLPSGYQPVFVLAPSQAGGPAMPIPKLVRDYPQDDNRAYQFLNGSSHFQMKRI